MRLKLFPKIFILTCSLMLALVAVMHFIFYSHFYYSNIDNQEKLLQRQAGLIAQTFEGFDEDLLKQAVEAFSRNNTIKAIVRDPKEQKDAELATEFNFAGQSKSNYVFIVDRTIHTAAGKELLLQIMSTEDVDMAARDKSFSFLPYTLIACVLFALITSYIYAKIVTSPIYRSMQVTRRMEELDKSAYLPENGQDEIADLNRQINSVYRKLLTTISDLEQRNQEMLTLEKMKVNFLRSTSHELKTPLAGLKVMLENMLYDVGRYKDHKKYLQLSIAVVDRLHAMIRGILVISKLAELKPPTEKLELAPLLQELVKEHEVLVQEKQLDLQIDVGDTCIYLPEIACRQVLANLISNAVKYTVVQGKIRIYVAAGCLCVFNTCQPLSQEDIRDVFALLPQKLSEHSTGLGLYLIRNILQTYKIKYQFAEVEGGMCFSLQLKPEERDISSEKAV